MTELDYVISVREKITAIFNGLAELEEFVVEHNKLKTVQGQTYTPPAVEQEPVPSFTQNEVGTTNFKIDREDPDFSMIPLVDKKDDDGKVIGKRKKFSPAACLEVVNALRSRQGFFPSTRTEFTATTIADAIHRSDSGVRLILHFLYNQGFVRQTNFTSYKARIWEIVR